MVASLSVETTNSETNGISFVYFTAAQTGTDMYNGTGTAIGTATAASGDTAQVTNVAFPVNMTASSVTYYVYAIINPTPDMGTCRPFQEIQVTVDPLPTVDAGTAQTICGG